MVRLKNEPKKSNWIADAIERVNETHVIIATRYGVVEVTPPVDEYGYQYVPEKRVLVSPFFDTKEEALDWFSEHEPDKGKRLVVFTQHKRRTVTERWW